MTLKQRIGAWLIPRLPINPWQFQMLRVELRAVMVRILNRIHPVWIARRRALQRRRGLLVNVGCGPFGLDGWVNLELDAIPGVTHRVDCRRRLPLSDNSARGIHVEHYFEHLQPLVERPRFLAECRRCLEDGGVLRIIVPDARRYMEAYLEPGWEAMNKVHGSVLETAFATKMDALNHVMVQYLEHYGGIDAESLGHELTQAGFHDVQQVEWRQGHFPDGAIDRLEHRPYSLYMECRSRAQGGG